MPPLLAIPGTSKSSDFSEYPDLIEIPGFSRNIVPSVIKDTLMDVVDLTSD